MRKSLLFLLAFVISAIASAQTTIPVTGNLSQILGSPQPYASVTIQLQNCPAPVSVTGSSVLVTTQADIQADGSGFVNSTVIPNDLINCNGTTGSSQYAVSYIVGGVPSANPVCFQVASTQGVWNLNTQQPIVCGQTPPNPQDVTWNNVVVNQNLSAATASFGSVNVTGGGVAKFKAVNLIQKVDQFSGATADVKLAACVAALPNGGTCDATGLGAPTTQTISSTTTLGDGVHYFTFLFDPSTRFVPATLTTNMFIIPPLATAIGLHIDASAAGYSGNAVAFKGYIYGANTPQSATIFGSFIDGGSNTTGNAILLESDDTNFVQYVHIEDNKIHGFAKGIYLHAGGAGAGTWVTDAYIVGNVIEGSVIGRSLVADKGNMEGNKFIGNSYQHDTNTSYGLQMLNPGGGVFEANEFDSDNIWDTPTAVNVGSGVIRTWYRGRFDGTCTGACGTTVPDTSFNTFINQRFCDTSSCYAFGSYGGVWINAHSGFGLRINATDRTESWQLAPDPSTVNMFDLVEPGVGTAAQFSATGQGTVTAGTGLGTFNGASVYAGSGFTVAIPTAPSSGYHLSAYPSTVVGIQGVPTGVNLPLDTGIWAANHLISYDVNGAHTDSGILKSAVPTFSTTTAGQATCIKSAGPPVQIGTCSTVVSASGACTCN
jgi:hypothetical protein